MIFTTTRLRRTSITAALLATVGLLAACGSDSIGQEFPIAVTTSRTASGQTVYAENCASCHGTPGISRPAIPTAPPHDESGHTWHHPDRLLFQWVLDRPPLAEVMPAFRGTLSDEEVLDVIAYIKSLWPQDIRELQQRGTLQYEQQLRESS